MITTCGYPVGNLWKESALFPVADSSNWFRILPQVFHGLSTERREFSTSDNRNLSTFPQSLLLQLYILTNPYYLDGEF